jgi:hypothetical protein
MTHIVAAATIAEQQDFRGLWIVNPAVSEPPKLNAGTSKFRSIMARANRQVSDVAGHIIESMRDGHAIGGRAKIMVIDLDWLLCVEFAIAIKITD